MDIKVLDNYQTIDYQNGHKLTDKFIVREYDNVLVTSITKNPASFFNKFGLVSLDSKNLNNTLEIEPQYTTIDNFNNSLAIATKSINNLDDKYKKDTIYYLIDTRGNILFKANYLKYISDIGYIYHIDFKYSLIDNNCQTLIEPVYDNLYYLASKYFVFEINDKKGLCDINNKIIIEPNFDSIEYVNSSRFLVHHPNGNWMILDNKKNIIKELSNSNQNYYVSEGYVCYRNRKNYYGILDCDGNNIVKPKLKQGFIIYENGMMVGLNPKNKYKIFNLKRKQVFASSYEAVSNFSYDVTSVYHKKVGWLLIDQRGNIIKIPCQKVIDFCNNVFNVIGNNFLYRLIDKTGKPISSYYTDLHFLNDKIIRVKKDNKFGLMNFKGELLCPIKYDSISLLYDGIAEIKLDSKKGLITEEGKELILFDDPEYFDYERKENLIVCRIDPDKMTLLDIKGKIYIDRICLEQLIILNDHQIIIDNHLFNLSDIQLENNIDLEFDGIKVTKKLSDNENLKDLLEALKDKIILEEQAKQLEIDKINQESKKRIQEILTSNNFELVKKLKR